MVSYNLGSGKKPRFIETLNSLALDVNGARELARGEKEKENPPLLSKLATFRLEYEDDYEYEFTVLSMRFRLEGRNFSKCACSEPKTRTRSRPRTPI